jgi:hypothetical protein
MPVVHKMRNGSPDFRSIDLCSSMRRDLFPTCWEEDAQVSSLCQEAAVGKEKPLADAKKAVFRIWDVFPGSEFYPSRIRIFPSRIPDPHQRIQVLTQKIYSKLPEVWYRTRLFIPDPDPDLLPIPDPGSRGQKDTGFRIRNTVKRNLADLECTGKQLWFF